MSIQLDVRDVILNLTLSGVGSTKIIEDWNAMPNDYVWHLFMKIFVLIEDF